MLSNYNLELKEKSVFSDYELIDKLIKEKDNKWFGFLYDNYASKVFNKCLSLVHDMDLAKDLTHDVFIKAFLNISRFNKSARFYTWIYAITYNACIDYLKESKKYIVLSTVKEIEEEDITIDENDDELMSINIDRLRVLMEKIPIDDKLILLMKYQDDMTHKEISDFFEIGESATKMRISRAKKKLIDLYNIKYRHSTYYLNK